MAKKSKYSDHRNAEVARMCEVIFEYMYTRYKEGLKPEKIFQALHNEIDNLAIVVGEVGWGRFIDSYEKALNN